jgi:hypothetical protein
VAFKSTRRGYTDGFAPVATDNKEMILRLDYRTDLFFTPGLAAVFKKRHPGLKFIIFLRNPVEAVWSDFTELTTPPRTKERFPELFEYWEDAKVPPYFEEIRNAALQGVSLPWQKTFESVVAWEKARVLEELQAANKSRTDPNKPKAVEPKRSLRYSWQRGVTHNPEEIKLIEYAYYLPLKEWLSTYPRDSFFISTVEELAQHPESTMQKLSAFLELEESNWAKLTALDTLARKLKVVKRSSSGTINEQGKRLMLQRLYAPLNKILAKYVDISKWDS